MTGCRTFQACSLLFRILDRPSGWLTGHRICLRGDTFLELAWVRCLLCQIAHSRTLEHLSTLLCLLVFHQTLWKRSRTLWGHSPISPIARGEQTAFAFNVAYCRLPWCLWIQPSWVLHHHQRKACCIWRLESCRIAASYCSCSKCSRDFWFQHKAGCVHSSSAADSSNQLAFWLIASEEEAISQGNCGASSLIFESVESAIGMQPLCFLSSKLMRLSSCSYLILSFELAWFLPHLTP